MKGNINPEYAFEVRKLIGSWLKEARAEQKMTQDDLANKMGMSRSTISKIEDGRWNFGIDTLTLFCIHLNIFLFLVPKNSNDDLAQSMRDRWERGNDGN